MYIYVCEKKLGHVTVDLLRGVSEDSIMCMYMCSYMDMCVESYTYTYKKDGVFCGIELMLLKVFFYSRLKGSFSGAGGKRLLQEKICLRRAEEHVASWFLMRQKRRRCAD